MIEDTLRNIDFSNAFNVLENLIDDCRIKKFRRKFRRNGRITYTKYLITYNPVRDLIVDNLAFSLKRSNKFLKSVLNKQSNE